MAVPGSGPLVIDLAGIDVSASQVSILANHDATLSGVIGFGRAMVSGGKLLVAGTTSLSRQRRAWFAASARPSCLACHTLIG